MKYHVPLGLLLAHLTASCASSSADCKDDPCCVAGPSPSDQLVARDIRAVDAETVAVELGHLRAFTCQEDQSNQLTWKGGAWHHRREQEFGVRRPFTFAAAPSSQTFADRGLTIQQSLVGGALRFTAQQDGRTSTMDCRVSAGEVTCTP